MSPGKCFFGLRCGRSIIGTQATLPSPTNVPAPLFRRCLQVRLVAPQLRGLHGAAVWRQPAGQPAAGGRGKGVRVPARRQVKYHAFIMDSYVNLGVRGALCDNARQLLPFVGWRQQPVHRAQAICVPPLAHVQMFLSCNITLHDHHAGTSLQNMQHWSQAARSGELALKRFDYGTVCEDAAGNPQVRKHGSTFTALSLRALPPEMSQDA